jgi:chromosome partitioning protein
MARVIAICNQKGGVGKTTTAVNLGAALALSGKRVLLIDFDPQANATSALGMDPAKVRESIYHGVCGLQEATSLLQPSLIFNYHFIPAAPHLAGLLVELVTVPEREYLLRRFISSVRHQYDYIIIDLAPSLTLLAVNALIASDEVLIPVQAEYYSLEGLGQLLQTLELIKQNLQHELKVTGALLTMYNKRERLSREVAKNLREHFPYTVFETEIPRSVALAEAPSFSKPVFLHRPDSHGAAAYRRLAEEVVKQEQQLLEALHQGHISQDFGNFNIRFTI